MKEIKKYCDIIRYGKSSTQNVIQPGDIISITEKVDGCFHYDTNITLADGSKEKIGRIVNNKMEVEVMSYNFETKSIEPRKITNWHNHGKKKEFICFKYQSPLRQGGRPNKIICTKDHLFLTDGGWKEAQYLTTEDTIYTFCEKMTNPQEQLILGTLLGDSSIYPTIKSGITESRNRGITFSHSNKQSEYAEFKNNILDSYFLKMRDYISGYGSDGKQTYSICCKPIEELIQKCVDGKGSKKVREEWIQMINPIGLAFWYMDDGSLSIGNGNQKERVTLHTEGFSEDEVDLLINMLKVKFNLNASKIYYKDKYFKIDLDTRSSDIFFDLVSPYIIRSMQYKLPTYKIMNNNFWDYYANNNTENSLYPIKIIEHSELPSYRIDLNNYDIEVEGNHNYFAGGILAHNSNASFTYDEENPFGVSCYSRRLPLTIGNTLQGFYGWVIDNIVPIKEELNPNYRYIGEWTCPHKIQYKEEYTKTFLLFSIWDEKTEQYLSDEIVKQESERLGLETVEYFYYGEFISYEHMMSFVGKSNITKELNTGEGVVVKNVNYFDKHGKQVFVKLVSERFAELQAQKLPKNPNVFTKEVSVIKSVLTKPRVDKLLHKLVDEDLLAREEFVIENMGKLLKLLKNRIVEDMLKEESEILKDIEGEILIMNIYKILPLVLKEVLKDY